MSQLSFAAQIDIQIQRILVQVDELHRRVQAFDTLHQSDLARDFGTIAMTLEQVSKALSGISHAQVNAEFKRAEESSLNVMRAALAGGGVNPDVQR